MTYNLLKIIHIISAAGLVAGMGHAALGWIKQTLTAQTALSQTGGILLPAALFQLLSGGALISLNHPQLIEKYIVTAFAGFTGLAMAWFGFIYTLLFKPLARSAQGGFLIMSAMTLVIMVFAMSNMVAE